MAGGRESTAAEIFVGNRVELAVTLQRPEHSSHQRSRLFHMFMLLIVAATVPSISAGDVAQRRDTQPASQPAKTLCHSASSCSMQRRSNAKLRKRGLFAIAVSEGNMHPCSHGILDDLML